MTLCVSDAIVDEVRAIREAYAESFGNDPAAIVADLCSRQAQHPRRLVSPARLNWRYPLLMSSMPRTPEVAELVRRLSLTPHPEGGWYRETHRSAQLVHSPAHGERTAFTSILFLLEAPQVSRFHRIDAEELWNWHAGSPLDVQVLAQGGTGGQRMTHHLGPSADECFQAVVPAGSWFAAEVASPGSWSLVGCVVAPGFEFRRFEMADRKELLANYPLEAETVLRLTPCHSGCKT